MTRIYHITSAEEARDAARSGTYAPNAFEADGFIHCSYLGQVREVANRVFSAHGDLVLLEIDRTRLTCEVIDENLEGGTELYPHIYGRVPASAVVQIHPFRRGDDGRFELPETVENKFLEADRRKSR